MGCNCGKPKPPPHGHPNGAALTASVGGSGGTFVHVAPSGERTAFKDMLGARAEVARRGGSIEIK